MRVLSERSDTSSCATDRRIALLLVVLASSQLAWSAAHAQPHAAPTPSAGPTQSYAPATPPHAATTPYVAPAPSYVTPAPSHGAPTRPYAAPTPNAASPQEPRPPSGIGAIVVGWTGLGLGLLNFFTLPLCFVDFGYSTPTTQSVCTALTVALGGAELIVGAVGLSIGYPRRAEYNRWRATHVRTELERLRPMATHNALGLGYVRQF
jgi:hypothetical protein